MLIDPDFLDHWRTRMLCDLLSDEMAPQYILRLWSHCQIRKADTFQIPAIGIKAICKFHGDADEFESALVQGGWLTRNGDDATVTKWADHNAKLVSAWGNGHKGGRPKKKTAPIKESSNNPTVTQRKPTDNPTETQSQFGLTHGKPIGLDERGLDKKKNKTDAVASGFDWDQDCPPSLNTEPVRTAWAEWLAYRRERKLTAWKPRTIKSNFANFAKHPPQVLVKAINKSISKGWAGLFEPENHTDTPVGRLNDKNTLGDQNPLERLRSQRAALGASK